MFHYPTASPLFEVIQTDSDENLSKMPTRGTYQSAGYDFYSPIDVILPAGKTTIIKTGVTAKMPGNIVLLLKSRSGLAVKGITTEGGVIDADYYPNDIGVILYNSTSTDFTVKAGDRISQGIFQQFIVASNDTVIQQRRTGGFGSTDEVKSVAPAVDSFTEPPSFSPTPCDYRHIC